MPSWKSSGKHSSQLLFSEALAQPKAIAMQGTSPGSAPSPAASPPLEATDCILQEIAEVGRRLETMDARISELTVASSSIRANIAGVRETVRTLDQRLTIMEDHVAVLPGQEAELRSLRAKVTDLENRSHRDNICLFSILEHKEGSDVKTFLKNLLPELAGLEYLPPLEFQRAHRIGPLHKATPTNHGPSSYASCGMNKLARPFWQPNPKDHSPLRDMKSGWWLISPDQQMKSRKHFLPFISNSET
ncbi:hypothetical protein NDU88_005066 [Pleurodeles waltl]|uniref:Uncharacterized protein n=1 Tax=Pleurodeles waltl TaxID=8319 RepID=A0AAV7M862_PLEWA|nr:hypothetical protein NDU88_005066 [Pleurodeles waltl]